jgi:dipeptidase E
MRLYLASAHLGAAPERVLEIVEPGARVAVIMNAWDGDPGSRAEEASHMLAQFSSLGLEAGELDLREHVADDSDARLRRRLAGVGLVFAHGGNTFVLRRAMRASGFDHVIRQLVSEDRLAYGGESAGAIVAGPTLHGLELGDDLSVIPAGYRPDVEWSGLGLVDFVPLPHADTDWWAAKALLVRDALAEQGVSARLLGDDDVVVVRGPTFRC